ncbi:MAG: 23S rRNA (adenine(2503)-C(2))-methyltransferase RlmN [Terracidiphilus sp.]
MEKPLFGLDAETLSRLLVAAGEPAYRGKQIAEAIYRQWVSEISEISTLSSALRAKLAARGWRVGRPVIAHTFKSSDGTERYLVELGSAFSSTDPMRTRHPAMSPGDANPQRDNPDLLPQLENAAGELKAETVETVWMPEGDGVEEDEADDQKEKKNWSRATICVSSQIGCAVNCQFCLTAKLGLQRNLTAGEIAGQVVAVLARQSARVGRDRVNLVFMGMGEPFLNYDSFMAAVRLLVREVGLSPQRMTVSTSGIVPGILRFASEPPDVRPRLAISLNAPNDAIRAEVMPINRKWPIDDVIEAVRRVPLRPRERITFEYVLLGGVTDRPEQAREAARLVRRTGLPAKVNLIAWNPGPGIAYEMPSPASVAAFHELLMGEGIAAYIRQPRGRDIFAACGQLKRTVEG